MFDYIIDCVILEGYGLSESSPVACFNHPHLTRKPGSIGVPVRDVALRVVSPDGDDVAVGEVGEILIKGPNVMKGYYTIVDRKKDLIIRGGGVVAGGSQRHA